MTFDIVPLGPEHLATLGPAVDAHFSYFTELIPSECFHASLDPEAYRELLERHEIRSLRYFVAVAEDKIVGVSGTYESTTDWQVAAWLGWYWVAESYRGRRIGAALLKRAIDEARRMQKAYFRLYTSDHALEVEAQSVYEKCGLVETHRDPPEIGPDGSTSQTIYREKCLLVRQ